MEIYKEIFERTEEQLECGGQHGRQLLKTLLQLATSECAKLASSALKVLFRQFTQYHEFVDDLKQVIFLVWWHEYTLYTLYICLK